MRRIVVLRGESTTGSLDPSETHTHLSLKTGVLVGCPDRGQDGGGVLETLGHRDPSLPDCTLKHTITGHDSGVSWPTQTDTRYLFSTVRTTVSVKQEDGADYLVPVYLLQSQFDKKTPPRKPTPPPRPGGPRLRLVLCLPFGETTSSRSESDLKDTPTHLSRKVPLSVGPTLEVPDRCQVHRSEL